MGSKKQSRSRHNFLLPCIVFVLLEIKFHFRKFLMCQMILMKDILCLPGTNVSESIHFQNWCWMEIEKQRVLLCWVKKLRYVHVNIISPSGKTKCTLPNIGSKAIRFQRLDSVAWTWHLVPVPMCQCVQDGQREQALMAHELYMGDPCSSGGAAALYGGSTTQCLRIALDLYG